MSEFLRGTVWAYEFEPGAPAKPALIVSNNARNQSGWRYVHVVRITTAPKSALPTIVELDGSAGLVGRVLCDELAPVAKGALGRRFGSLTPGTMRRVDEALKRVLSLT